MYDDRDMPRRPAIPRTLYAFVSVLLAERMVLERPNGWFWGFRGVVALALCAVVVAMGIVALARRWALAGTLWVVLASAAVGVLLSSLVTYGGERFTRELASSSVSDWEFRICSDATKKDDAYRCRATMWREGSAHGDVWLTLPQRCSVGATVRCIGRFVANGDDEWGISSRLQGVWGSVRAVRMLHSSPPEGLLAFVLGIRSAALDSIEPSASPERALLAGCVCGWRQDLKERGLDKSFSRCGLSHLIAVSGSHLAIFTALLGGLLDRLQIRRGLRAVALMGSCGLFVLFCGLPISAIRAWIMASLAMASPFAGRRSHGLSGVSVAGLAMAMADPSVCGQIGFLLSVSSVCGLCLFSAYASYAIESLFGAEAILAHAPKPIARALSRACMTLRDTLAATFVAQASTMGITAQSFGELSLVGPFANTFVAVPFTLLVGVGLVGVACASIPLLSGGALCICDMLAHAVIEMVGIAEKIPYHCVRVADGGHAIAVCMGLLALVVLLLWPRVSRSKVLPATCALAVIVLGYHVWWRYFAPARVCVLDVGQGDAILVQEGSATLLVDTGPDDAIVEALQRNHVTHLDAVLITHLHDDHYAGLSELVGNVACEHIYVAEGVAKGMPEKMLRACDELVQGKVEELSYNDILRVRGFELRMVWPRSSVDGMSNSDSMELMLRYEDGDASLTGLLTGDAEKEETGSVISLGDASDLDFLKVGHHGSSVSITSEQAQYLDPEVSVASAGEGNTYGHPTSECVETLESAGSLFLCTKDVGDVEVRPAEGGPRVMQNTKP